MGWIGSGVRRKVEMLRYWNRLMKMDSERLTKNFFTWDFNKRTTGNWNSDIYKLFLSLDMTDVYYNNLEVDLDGVRKNLHDADKYGERRCQWSLNSEHSLLLRKIMIQNNSTQYRLNITTHSTQLNITQPAN